MKKDIIFKEELKATINLDQNDKKESKIIFSNKIIAMEENMYGMVVQGQKNRISLKHSRSFIQLEGNHNEIHIEHNEGVIVITGNKNKLIITKNDNFEFFVLGEDNDMKILEFDEEDEDGVLAVNALNFSGPSAGYLRPERGADLCAICYNPLGEGYEELSCGHCFHSSCLALWLKRSNECPICRRKIR